MPSAPGRSPFHAGDFQTDDFDQIRAALARWNQRYDQLDDGRFQGRFTFAFLGDLQLVRFEVNRVVRSTGACPPDSILFTPVTPAVRDSSWRGRHLKPGMVNVLPSSTPIDHRTCPGYTQSSILVPRALLEKVSLAVLGLGSDHLIGKSQALAIGESNAEALSQKLADSIRLCLASAQNNSSLNNHPQNARAVASLPFSPEDLVADLVIALGEGRWEDPVHATSGQRISAVRKVEEFVRENPDQRLGIVEMCRLGGVSRRTLHYAFLEVTGCSPHDFIKSIRLNQARRELKNRPRSKGQIEQVARSFGFFRSGSFASDFRRRFHQLPSAFLGRSGGPVEKA